MIRCLLFMVTDLREGGKVRGEEWVTTIVAAVRCCSIMAAPRAPLFLPCFSSVVKGGTGAGSFGLMEYTWFSLARCTCISQFILELNKLKNMANYKVVGLMRGKSKSQTNVWQIIKILTKMWQIIKSPFFIKDAHGNSLSP